MFTYTDEADTLDIPKCTLRRTGDRTSTMTFDHSSTRRMLRRPRAWKSRRGFGGTTRTGSATSRYLHGLAKVGPTVRMKHAASSQLLGCEVRSARWIADHSL
jgi:hypothetical protein